MIGLFGMGINNLLDLITTFLIIYTIIGTLLSLIIWIAYTKSEKIRKKFNEDCEKNGLNIDWVPLMILLIILLWGPILIEKQRKV